MRNILLSFMASAILLGCGSTGVVESTESTDLTGVVSESQLIINENLLDEKLASVGVEIIRDGHRVSLIMSNELLFETDRSLLTPEAKEMLLSLAETLQDNTKLNLDIIGHSDSRGSYYYNQELSFERSRQVQKFLRASGILNTTKIRSFGKLKPKCNNETEEGMMCNRRVELTLY